MEQLGNAIAGVQLEIKATSLKSNADALENVRQITRLEGLLRLPAYANYRFEHARVASRDFSGWWQRIVIRKGGKDVLQIRK